MAETVITINFSKGRPPITLDNEATLMRVLLAHSVPVASSCNGDGVCGKCKVQIKRGMQNLSAPTELEQFLREKYNLKPNERISCQILVRGDIEVDTTYW